MQDSVEKLGHHPAAWHDASSLGGTSPLDPTPWVGGVEPFLIQSSSQWACGCSDEGETPILLRLISSETFKTGVLNLMYGPAESPGDATYEDAKVHLPQSEE
jgi:hypothetical protein